MTIFHRNGATGFPAGAAGGFPHQRRINSEKA
jgi:hypothetical protein